MKRFLALLLVWCCWISAVSGCAASDPASNHSESASVSAAAETGSQTENGLTITAFAVGDADALLIEADGQTMLVDTGEADDAKLLLHELQRRGITQLDVLLITHFDKDHVGSAAQLLSQIPAGQILYPDYEGTTQEYQDFMAAIAGASGAAAVTEQTSILLGNASMTVYPAEDPEKIMKKKSEYDNDLSLVTMLTYGECRFLLTGDIQKTRISQLLDTDTDWSCDWIKLPHHGRYEKALKSLLKAADPQFAVVCTDQETEEETTELMNDRQISCLSTVDGNVVTTCDGTSVQMEIEN